MSQTSVTDLVTQLRAAGAPLHLMAADAFVNLRTVAERLQERVTQLEAIARLNGETIRSMQRQLLRPGAPNSFSPATDACPPNSAFRYCFCCVRFRCM